MRFSAFLQAWSVWPLKTRTTLTNVRYRDSPLRLRPYQKLPRSLLLAKEHARQVTPEAQAVVDAFVASLRDRLGMDTIELDLDLKLALIGYSGDRIHQLEVDSVASDRR